MLANMTSWSQVEFSKKLVKKDIFARLVYSVQGVSASEAYKKLTDYKARLKWDFLCK